VRRDLLKAWGGLSTADGFLQRSAVPPLFRDPHAFLRWFRDQRPRLLEANWDVVEPDPMSNAAADAKSAEASPAWIGLR
jgi:hypothetical protein